MSIIPYTYGGFNLNDMMTYYVDGVDLSPPPVNVTVAQVARNAGMKKTGEVVGEKKFSLIVSVVSPDGTRAGLRVALDALYKALDQRQQQIVLQDDGRYMIGDCIQTQAVIKNPNYVALQLDFECEQPYAYASSLSSFSANSSFSGPGPYSMPATVPGGGTVFAYPTLTITNTGAVNITQLTFTNANLNQILATSGLTLTPGDYATIVCDPGTAGATNSMGYTITKNGITATLYDFSGVFPTLSPDNEAWQVDALAASAPSLTAQWTWFNRYLA